LILSLADLLELNFLRPNPHTNEADCSMLKTSVLLHPPVPNRLKETNARTGARGRWTSPRLSPVAADVKGLRNTDPATTAIGVPTTSSSSLLRSTPYNWSGNNKQRERQKRKKQTDNQNTRSSNSLSREKNRKTNCLSTNKKFQFFSQQKLDNNFSYALEAIRCTQSDDGVPRTPTLSTPSPRGSGKPRRSQQGEERPGLRLTSRTLHAIFQPRKIALISNYLLAVGQVCLFFRNNSK
jgi:hypothetical protein